MESLSSHGNKSLRELLSNQSVELEKFIGKAHGLGLRGPSMYVALKLQFIPCSVGWNSTQCATYLENDILIWGEV